MFCAACSGDILTLQKSFRGEEFDVVDQEGKTPLHIAARAGHLVVVAFLLRQAVTLLNRKDNYGRTTLWFSTYSCHDSVTKRLLEEDDVDVNSLGRNWRDDIPSTSLHHLTIRRDTVVLRLFLAVLAIDPNLCGRSQYPLYKAIDEGNTAVAKLLLAHKKTQVNAVCLLDDSPLYLATRGGHFDIVKLLTQQGD